MSNICFPLLCFFVVATELHAAPVAVPEEPALPAVPGVSVSTTPPPLWPAFVALASQSNQLLDQSYQRLKDYGKSGGQYVSDKVQSGGKYLREELDNAVSQGYNGYRYVSDNVSNGVQRGKDFVQQNAAEGLRKGAAGVGSIGDYRRTGLNNAANYVVVGAQRLNELLDRVNAYLQEKLSNAASAVQNPGTLNVGG